MGHRRLEITEPLAVASGIPKLNVKRSSVPAGNRVDVATAGGSQRDPKLNLVFVSGLP